MKNMKWKAVLALSLMKKLNDRHNSLSYFNQKLAAWPGGVVGRQRGHAPKELDKRRARPPLP